MSRPVSVDVVNEAAIRIGDAVVPLDDVDDVIEDIEDMVDAARGLGLDFVDEVKRDYGKGRDGSRRPGVTTVIGTCCGWNTGALVSWSASRAAEYAVENAGRGAPEDVKRRAARMHYCLRRDAGAAGTLAHGYVTTWLVAGVMPPDEGFVDESPIEAKARAAFERFRAWWPGSGYDLVEAETPMVDEQADYGGTRDLLLRRKSDGALVLADLKTGKSIYDEVAIQLGAYALLEAKRGTVVHEGLVIHCPAEGGDVEAVPVPKVMLECGAATFMALLTVYRAKKQLKLKLNTKKNANRMAVL